MKTGISTYTLPLMISSINGRDMPAKAASLISLARKHDIDHLQIGDNLPLHELTELQLNHLLADAENSKVRIQVGMRGLISERIIRYIEFAKKFHSPFLRVVIDDEHFHPTEQEIIETIRSLLPELKKQQILLAIENHDRFPVETLRRIIERTDPDFVGVCLDTANSLGAGEGVEQVIRVLAPYTVNLHVKDFSVVRVSNKMGFNIRGATAGTGMLDIPGLAKYMLAYPKCTVATLELWSKTAPTLSQGIADEMISAEKSIHYLKKIFK